MKSHSYAFSYFPSFSYHHNELVTTVTSLFSVHQEIFICLHKYRQIHIYTCMYFGKRPWCWERLNEKGEGGDRRWDGWVTSPTQWIWVWASSGRQWRTGKSGMLWSTGLQSWMWLSYWTANMLFFLLFLPLTQLLT